MLLDDLDIPQDNQQEEQLLRKWLRMLANIAIFTGLLISTAGFYLLEFYTPGLMPDGSTWLEYIQIAAYLLLLSLTAIVGGVKLLIAIRHNLPVSPALGWFIGFWGILVLGGLALSYIL